MNNQQQKELEKDMEQAKEELVKDIFDTVYQWGRVGVVADYTAKTYQDMIKKLAHFI